METGKKKKKGKGGKKKKAETSPDEHQQVKQSTSESLEQLPSEEGPPPYDSAQEVEGQQGVADEEQEGVHGGTEVQQLKRDQPTGVPEGEQSTTKEASDATSLREDTRNQMSPGLTPADKDQSTVDRPSSHDAEGIEHGVTVGVGNHGVRSASKQSLEDGGGGKTRSSPTLEIDGDDDDDGLGGTQGLEDGHTQSEVITDQATEIVGQSSYAEEINSMRSGKLSSQHLEGGISNVEVDSTTEQEFSFEPLQQTENLPEFDNLMDAIDGGESDLETDREPPRIFKLPEQATDYQQISDLQTTLQDQSIDPYIDTFDSRIRDEVLMIGNISLQEVQEEERRLRDEHIAYQQQEMSLARQRQEAILRREETAKDHVIQIMKEKRKNLARQEELNLQRERLLQNHLHHAFKRSENQLKRSLTLRKGEIKTMYGDLMMADGEYGGSKGRRWKVDWNKSPQPIQIKINCLRGVKDKLPAGCYVLMASLYDRLGGHVLRWSNLRGQEWGGATLPLNHDGSFFNIEINVDQSVFTVLPAKSRIKPGMVLLFELFLLRGTLLPVDKVVSWGIFPICDAQFEVLQGRYKMPMLRGEFDPRIEKHEVVEKLMASDLDHWMSNLYFEIIKLPRYIAGQKEYEVELQFSSQLMSFPDRVKGAEDSVDGEQPIQGSSLTLTSQGKSLADGSSLKEGTLSELGVDSAGTSSESIPKKSSSDDKISISERTQSPERVKSTEGVRFRGSGRNATVFGSRKMLEKGEKAYMDDSDGSEDEMTRDDGFRAVKGEPGLYYKHHTNPAPTDYLRRIYTMLPRTALLNQKKRRKKLTHLETLEMHTFSVQSTFSTKGHLERKGHEKVEYVSRQARSEMGLSQWRSREFWTLILLMCLVFFIRMYLHYIGQWAYLSIINIPVSSFKFYPYTVSLNYQSSLLHTREEVVVVFLGPATNVLILLTLVSICWFTQKFIGNFPDLFCKFIMVYAILTFLDPILIAIVDAPLGRYDYEVGDEPIADAAKLYFHFYRIHNNGLMGILLTVPIYLSLMFLTFVIFYMYFLRLHNNGRMLDIYHRLHAPEDEFFVPFDLEISSQELAYICKKAEQWRGEEGERRKVAVYDYIWSEQQDGDVLTPSSSEEVTTHISIHTLHLDGLREMYRHFLKLPDGAIVEVFGEMGVAGIDKDLKTALQNEEGPSHRLRPPEDIESQDSLNVPQVFRETGVSRIDEAAPQNEDGPSHRPRPTSGIESQDSLSVPAAGSG